MNNVERRYVNNEAELRAADSRTIGGYASVFNKPSSNLGGFIEQVDSRAFNKSAGDGFPGVVARFNHQDQFLLGTTRSGTLRLSVDGNGLAYEVDVPQTRQDVLELVQRGDVTKSSFAFITHEDQWSMSEQNYPVRTLMKVQLVDVAPVTTPAYPDSSAGLRSLATAKEAEFEEVRKLAQENELRKLFVRTYRPVLREKPTLKTIDVNQARMDLLARKECPYI